MSEIKSIKKPVNLITGKTLQCGIFVNKDNKIEQLTTKNFELKRFIE
jgi:hypothetical protein